VLVILKSATDGSTSTSSIGIITDAVDPEVVV
jgi:hypothetical protein